MKNEPPLQVWTAETRYALIDEVKKFANLWDVKSRSFKDAQSGDLNRHDIAPNLNNAFKINFDGECLLCMWKRLSNVSNESAHSPALGQDSVILDDDIDANAEQENVTPFRKPRRSSFPGRRRNDTSTKQTVLSKICGALNSIKDRKPRDENDIFGEYVANTPRTMESKDAKKARMLKLDINGILIEHERSML
ncbi:hypothetical protein Aduo_008222 [Ancylostoma duodenale]